MFLPLSMQKVYIQMMAEDVPDAALVLAQLGVFQPEISDEYSEQLPESPATLYREHLQSSLAQLQKILKHLDINITETSAVDSSPITLPELVGIDQWLGHLWHECSQHDESIRRNSEQRKRLQQLRTTLDEFSNLDIDLDLLHSQHQFLDLRVGTLPETELDRIKEAVGIADYTATHFFSIDGTAHVLLAGPVVNRADIDKTLEVAGWHAMAVPPEFHGHPDQVRSLLESRSNEIDTRLQDVTEQISYVRQVHEARLLDIAQVLTLASPYAELAQSLRVRGELALISGWVPKRSVADLRNLLTSHFSDCVVLTSRDPLPEELTLVPTALHHRHWLKPFTTLVKGYGIPSYDEFDPTLLFTLTFVLMFGMMFGDVGHGAVIATGALLMRRVLGQFTILMIIAGLMSVVFGFIYGSIFGNEHVIAPLWISPLSDPVRMLSLAVYWGIGFILVATILTISNRFRQRRFHLALFNSDGMAGLALYLGLMFAAYQWIINGQLGTLELLFVLLPMTLISIVNWRKYRQASTGERVLVVIIEGFEAVMSYVSNTLSFLRVAAFSLNHVALAIAVFTLAGMLDQFGYWVTVVLGNVFIIVLEGAIVMIQILRLEYYEGFSRFFSGNGREFRPLVLPSNGIQLINS